MDEVNKIWTPKKKRSKCWHKHPPRVILTCSSTQDVQFLKPKCAVTKLTKIALKQSSHLLITLVGAPENARNAVIEHQKYKRFLGEDPRPSYFPHKLPPPTL
jgi:hypothetical protein